MKSLDTLIGRIRHDALMGAEHLTLNITKPHEYEARSWGGFAEAIKDIDFEHINIAGGQLDRSSAEHLADILKTHHSVSTLSLSALDFVDHSIELLLGAIRKAKHLRNIYYYGNKMTALGRVNDIEDERLLQVLAEGNRVKYLMLAYNYLGLSGSMVLANLLKSNTELEELHLVQNNIDLDGLHEIFKALGVNHRLKVLHINGVDNLDASKIHKFLTSLISNRSLVDVKTDIKDKKIQSEIERLTSINRKIKIL